MIDELMTVLEEFAEGNVYLQGTMEPNQAYPASFITYFISDSDFDTFYSDDSNRIVWTVSVIYYTSDPDDLQETPPEIIAAMKQAGFLPQNAGISVISDEPSHNGCAMDFIYPEHINKE